VAARTACPLEGKVGDGTWFFYSYPRLYRRVGSLINEEPHWSNWQ